MENSKLMDKLKDYGADVPGATARFLGDLELYDRCFGMFLEDASFAELGAALADKDCRRAFEAAHTLKGVAGNLGLTPLLNDVVDIVEPLRAGRCDGLEPKYADIMAQLEKLKAMV